MKRLTIFATVLLLAVLAVPAAAQVVVNPSTIEFDPSADHSTISALDGLPKVASYSLQFWAVGGQAPVLSQDLGKPALATDGKIRIASRSLFTASALLADTKYVAVVVAVGPAGESSGSPQSNPFGNAAPPRAVAAAPKLIR